MADNQEKDEQAFIITLYVEVHKTQGFRSISELRDDVYSTAYELEKALALRIKKIMVEGGDK